MVWLALLALAVFVAISYRLGKAKAVRISKGVRSHSRPNYLGAYVALWAGVPAALLLAAFFMFGGKVEHALLAANPPPAVAALPAEQAEVFYFDAVSLAQSKPAQGVYEGELKSALDAKAAQSRSLHNLVTGGVFGLAALLALAGVVLALPRLTVEFRARNRVEVWVRGVLIACSAVAVFTTLGIISSLSYEAFRFFSSVSPAQFLFGLDWSPQSADGGFGILPVFAGTFLIMILAMMVAAPIGLFAAIYLSEYASRSVRGWVKPMLEILAGIPSVVYGVFAALTVGPLFRGFFNWVGAEIGSDYLLQVQNQMALTAGVVMGIMLIPFVSSLSDDIINAVPQALRDGSYAMGATKSETVKKVVMPAALPGVSGALLLAASRAIGETMIVTLAAGLQAKLTANPLDTVTTVTAQIVNLLQGDQEFDSPRTLSAFGLGLTLFCVTLLFNVIASQIVKKYREQYD